VRIIPSKDIESVASAWFDIPMPARIKVLYAIDVAPIMVRESLSLLDEHLKLADAWDRNPTDTQTGQALLKYFHLQYGGSSTLHAQYWRYVRGIRRVFGLILQGLQSPYDLVIAWLGGAGGVVIKDMNPRPVSPIRKVFGFADEWGHVAWTLGAGTPGRIRLGYEYIEKSQTRPEDVARTLVHEASHKWARTKDILYKSQSLAYIYRDDADSEALGQKSIPIAGRRTPLKPMTGLDLGPAAQRPGGPDFPLIDDERYLENADSYAWTARRLWKVRGRPVG